MKRLLSTILIACLIAFFAVNGWGATWYIDKRCANNGNGTAQSCAALANGAGAWKALTNAMDNSKTGAGSHTYEYQTCSGGGSFDFNFNFGF